MSRHPLARSLAAGAIACVLAGAAPLSAGARTRAALPVTVERLPVEPAVVVALDSAGATPLERYRAGHPPGPLPAGEPVVVIVRLPVLNTPDMVKASAFRTGARTVAVEIDVARFTGPLAANVATEPLVQVSLGSLSPGVHRVKIAVTEREFADLAHPEKTAAPRPAMRADVEIQVR